MVAVVAALAFAQAATAGEAADDLLMRYAALARQVEPDFTAFSAERGRTFYFEKHVLAGIGEASCASCHLEDPRLAIRAHRAPVLCRACHVINDHEHPDPEHAKKRHLPPFAPTRNPERFNDFARVERYFQVNCRMLMKRDCTAREKGDLITWLLTLK